ncbi:MAG: manganese efflux pump MntP family protein [Anaerolineales bacterium]|jgi:putative Mn2+ efflux pump MntP
MNFFEIFLIALSMSMDAFAVCLAAGTQESTTGLRPTFRLAFHFGLFQFLMPVIGWFAGTTVLRYISAYDQWVAFGLLAFVGLRMVRSGIDQNSNAPKANPSRGWTLVILAIATSIDALAIGFSLGLVGVTIWYPAVVIGVVTGLVSWLGILLGNRLGVKFGKRMEIIGGIILILIGIWIVLSHFLA